MHLIDYVMQSVCNAYLLAKCSQTQFYSIKKKKKMHVVFPTVLNVDNFDVAFSLLCAVVVRVLAT